MWPPIAPPAHRSFRLPALLALALPLAAMACGDDGGAGSAPDPLAVASYCSAWSDAACGSAARCGCGIDGATCAMLAPSLCPLADGTPMRAGVDDGSIAYDEVSGARFVRRLRTAACGTRPLSCGGSGACISLSGGGGPCTGTEACDVGLSCVGSVCVAPRELGAACTDNLECASGRCDGTACAERAALGATCDGDTQCATGRCDFATGRCRDLEPLDALCTRDEECMTGYCERVELAGGHCREAAVLLPRGTACLADGDCADGACIADLCAPALCDELM